MHPLMQDISGITDQELENKTIELTKRYYQAIRFSPGAANQVSMILEGYNWERQRRSIEKMKKKGDDETGLEDLIKID
jgi:hypothetical protein